jgi:hypothetical protein
VKENLSSNLRESSGSEDRIRHEIAITCPSIKATNLKALQGGKLKL